MSHAIRCVPTQRHRHVFWVRLLLVSQGAASDVLAQSVVAISLCDLPQRLLQCSYASLQRSDVVLGVLFKLRLALAETGEGGEGFLVRPRQVRAKHVPRTVA